MKKLFTLLSIALTNLTFGQCVSISCPSDIYINSGTCSEVVNYTTPAGVDLCSSISTTFSYTGSVQTWVVPSGVNSINVNAYGAQGGSNWANNDNFGGQVIADLPVTPGTTLYIYVGQQPNGIAGGWNGGGNGESAGQGGGGASDIRIGGTTLNDRVIVAGAGGGAGYWSGEHVVGGFGGGLIAGYGGRVNYATNPGGEPGTQVGSGNGTCASFNNPICAGGFGYGGAPYSCGCEGYGGGGGWYGGAGSGNCRGGGGGSSYTHPSAINVTHNQGVRTGHGEITITYPGSTTGTIVNSQIAGLPSGSAFPAGTTTNEFMSVLNGDTVYCSFDVVVVDTIAPTLNIPSDTTICGPGAVNTISSGALDNCGNATVSYAVTGATNASGTGEADGTVFSAGTSTVTYTVVDESGNTTVASFEVTVYDLPSVALDAFTQDTLCDYNSAIPLPNGTPTGGTYSGAGVSGSTFDPSISGTGSHYIVYSYADSNGCSNADSSLIVVDGCLGIDNPLVEDRFEIFPVPTNSMVTVLFKDGIARSWSVMNTDGKIVATGITSSEFEIDFSNQPNGIYYFVVELEGKSVARKIVKQ